MKKWRPNWLDLVGADSKPTVNTHSVQVSDTKQKNAVWVLLEHGVEFVILKVSDSVRLGGLMGAAIQGAASPVSGLLCRNNASLSVLAWRRAPEWEASTDGKSLHGKNGCCCPGQSLRSDVVRTKTEGICRKAGSPSITPRPFRHLLKLLSSRGERIPSNESLSSLSEIFMILCVFFSLHTKTVLWPFLISSNYEKPRFHRHCKGQQGPDLSPAVQKLPWASEDGAVGCFHFCFLGSCFVVSQSHKGLLFIHP